MNEKWAKSKGISSSRSWKPQVNLHLPYQPEPQMFFISHYPSLNIGFFATTHKPPEKKGKKTEAFI